jgi:hypothetical protein
MMYIRITTRWGKAGKGAVALLERTREGTPFDDLARGLDTGAISRGKAIKLGGAALVASALGLFASQGAEAQEDVETAVSRRRCRERNDNFCKARGCKTCCNRDGRRPKACCGRDGCTCCRRNERCDDGRCRN